MSALLDALRERHRRPRHPKESALAGNICARLSDPEAAALSLLVAETGAGQSIIARMALRRLFAEVLPELGVTPASLGLEEV